MSWILRISAASAALRCAGIFIRSGCPGKREPAKPTRGSSDRVNFTCVVRSSLVAPTEHFHAIARRPETKNRIGFQPVWWPIRTLRAKVLGKRIRLDSKGVLQTTRMRPIVVNPEGILFSDLFPNPDKKRAGIGSPFQCSTFILIRLFRWRATSSH